MEEVASLEGLVSSLICEPKYLHWYRVFHGFVTNLV